MLKLPENPSLEDIQAAQRSLDEHAKEYFADAYNNTVREIQEFQPDNESQVPIGETFKQGKNYLASIADLIDQSQRPQPEAVEMSTLSREQIEEYETPYLIDQILLAERLTLFTGEGGIGKSFFALQFVAGLTMGIHNHAFFAAEPNNIDKEHVKDPIKVVYASYEESKEEVGSRLLQIEKALKWPIVETILKSMRFIDLKNFGPLWGVEHEKHYSTRAKLLDVGDFVTEHSKGYDLLIIDPAAGAFGANENERSAVREFTSFLNGWGQSEKCATMLIAHPPKSDSDYSGSTDWLGSCRMFWTLGTQARKGSAPGRGLRLQQGVAKSCDLIIDINHYVWRLSKSNYGRKRKPVPLVKALGNDETGWSPVWVHAKNVSEAEGFYAEYEHDEDQLAALDLLGNDDEPSEPNTQEDHDYEKSNRPQF